MRLLGHPVHVMLIHFPVALWPAHLLLHVVGYRLQGSAQIAFWLLVGGTSLGWLAALAGAADLLGLWRENHPRLKSALLHAGINGGVLLGFTILLALEYAVYPDIRHGAAFLASEAGLIAAMGAGNYFGGAIVRATDTR